MGITIEEINKEIAFAKMVIGAIDNVKVPMLIYEREKAVVRKALQRYIYDLENKAGLIDTVTVRYEEFCSKCKHKGINSTEVPCKECIDAYFNDWKNPNRKFGKYYVKEDKDA